MNNREFLSLNRFLKWVVLKNQIRSLEIEKDFFVFNNFIYWAHLGINIGSEQDEDRPVLVIRTSKESTVCCILPITLERLNDKRPYHIDLANGIGTVLIEQIRTISKDRIYAKKFVDRKQATITFDDWKLINEQIIQFCTLKPLFTEK